VINANTSPGRRVTPTCVVPESTASCAFGRSSNISTTSCNREKSRSPKISRGWHLQPAQLVGPTRKLVHHRRGLGRELVEVRRVGSDCVVSVAHRRKSAGVGMRSSSSGTLSRPRGRWRPPRRRSACRPWRAPTATAYATRPPRLKQKRSASVIPRRSSSATRKHRVAAARFNGGKGAGGGQADRRGGDHRWCQVPGGLDQREARAGDGQHGERGAAQIQATSTRGIPGFWHAENRGDDDERP
jgi:hypothetical protein